MTVVYARYVKPELVLEDLTEEATRFAKILQAETSGVRDGDGFWHGSDAFTAALYEMAPKIDELARLYRDATNGPKSKDFKDALEAGLHGRRITELRFMDELITELPF